MIYFSALVSLSEWMASSVAWRMKEGSKNGLERDNEEKLKAERKQDVGTVQSLIY